MPLNDEPVNLATGKKISSNNLPLWQRLGLKEKQSMAFLWAPPELIEKIKHDAHLADHDIELTPGFKYNYVHSFITSRFALELILPQILNALDSRGILWISLPDDKSDAPSDLSHRSIRELATRFGILEKKMVKIDEVWSAIQFKRDPNKKPVFKEVREVHRLGV